MKELHELAGDLQEDHDLLYKAGTDYLLRTDTGDYNDNTCLENVTVHDANDVMCDIQILKPQGKEALGRYFQYLKGVEEYEASRKRSQG